MVNKLLDFVNDFLKDSANMEKSFRIDADTKLFSNGLVDSLFLVSLVSFIESEFKVAINSTDITIENMDTINSIIKLVENKRLNYK